MCCKISSTLIPDEIYKKMPTTIECPATLLLFSCSLFVLSAMELSFAPDTLTSTLPLRDGETLISNKHAFELGFFSPGDSPYRFLGMWYKNMPQTVVWVANRNNPVTDRHGVLTFSNDGNLVILNLTKNIIWSSNVSMLLEKPVARLLDSGNFVLMGNDSMSSDNYLWQSFDYPSDTLLAGMKLVWSLNASHERYLTSWKSSNDPSTGDFIKKLDNFHGLITLYTYRGSKKYDRYGPFNGHTLEGFSLQGLPFTTVMKFDKNEVYYAYQPVFNTQISVLNLNPSGDTDRLVLEGTEWHVLYTSGLRLHLPCLNYSYCSANSVCRRSNARHPCECLDAFVPESTDKRGTPDQVCKREFPLDCGDRFQEFQHMYMPELLDVWMNGDMSLTECKANCLMNCSCKAFSYSGIGTGCVMWFGDLIDFKEVKNGYRGLDVYIRMRARRSNGKNVLKMKLVLSLPSTMLIIGFVLCFIWKKSRKRGMKNTGADMEVPLFDFATISAATENFSEANLLGVGGFGLVYKGNLLTGVEIAVKRLSNSSQQGIEEFMNEISLIGQLQHRNLVGLLGICIQREEQMLIYEYMSNKSLDYFIFEPNRKSLLPWPKRFDIVKGIARGLLYLHQDSKLQIIHRDLKAANILLDCQFNPKISDFGLARLFGDQKSSKTKRVVGTFGYMSPEYAVEGIISEKSDVFSFGVLLLEIVSGKKNRGFHSTDHFHNLLGHAWLLWHKERALELMDTCLVKESFAEYEVYRCIHIGLLCVQKFPDDRPAMSCVMIMLANVETALPEPKEPGFFTERSCDGSTSQSIYEGSTSESGRRLTITALDGREFRQVVDGMEYSFRTNLEGMH